MPDNIWWDHRGYILSGTCRVRVTPKSASSPVPTIHCLLHELGEIGLVSKTLIVSSFMRYVNSIVLHLHHSLGLAWSTSALSWKIQDNIVDSEISSYLRVSA